MKHRKFSSPQIAEAVFRGRKSPYSFEVYPLNIEFNPVAAVYIISRRKIDRFGKAHHHIVLMGQTESLATEVKNQRRVKTVKEYQANAVSVLLADDEKSRLAIEEDLKSAYALRQLRKPPEIKKTAFLKTAPPKTPAKAEAKQPESLKAKPATREEKTKSKSIEKPKTQTPQRPAELAKPVRRKIERKIEAEPVKPKAKSKEPSEVKLKAKPKQSRPKLKEPANPVVVQAKKKLKVANPKPPKLAGKRQLKAEPQIAKRTKPPKTETIQKLVIKKAKTIAKKQTKPTGAKPEAKNKTQARIRRETTPQTARIKNKKIENPVAGKSKAKLVKSKVVEIRTAKVKVSKIDNAKSENIKAKTVKSNQTKAKNLGKPERIAEGSAKAKAGKELKTRQKKKPVNSPPAAKKTKSGTIKKGLSQPETKREKAKSTGKINRAKKVARNRLAI